MRRFRAGKQRAQVTSAHCTGSAPTRRDRVVIRRSAGRSEEHTSELQSLMRSSYAVFWLKKKKRKNKEKKKNQKKKNSIIRQEKTTENERYRVNKIIKQTRKKE